MSHRCARVEKHLCHGSRGLSSKLLHPMRQPVADLMAGPVERGDP